MDFFILSALMLRAPPLWCYGCFFGYPNRKAEFSNITVIIIQQNSQIGNTLFLAEFYIPETWNGSAKHQESGTTQKHTAAVCRTAAMFASASGMPEVANKVLIPALNCF